MSAKNLDAKKIGVLATLGASVMWAIEPVLVKLAYVNSDYLQTSTIRAIIASLTALWY
jgi:hypothetical protein